MLLNIIHLPHRTDRLKLLQTELKQQEIFEYKIWNGIIDSSLPCRGISQAHKQIIRFAKESSIEEVLIAEDDIHFSASGALKYFIENKPSDYDIYLGSTFYGKIQNDDTINDFSGMTFYMIHKKFYDVVLSISEDIHLDRGLRNKGKYFVCNPFVAMQHNGYSDNHKKYFDYTPYFKDRRFYK